MRNTTFPTRFWSISSVSMRIRAIATTSILKKTDIAYAVRCKAGSRVDDNYLCEQEEV